MSTQIGTLQQRSAVAHVVWPAAGLALVVAVTFAVIAGSLGSDTPRDATPSTVSANTPSELNAARALPALGGTLANTPSELNAAGSTEPPQVSRSSPVDGPIGFHPLP